MFVLLPPICSFFFYFVSRKRACDSGMNVFGLPSAYDPCAQAFLCFFNYTVLVLVATLGLHVHSSLLFVMSLD
jgi:hypothetical protein